MISETKCDIFLLIVPETIFQLCCSLICDGSCASKEGIAKDECENEEFMSSQRIFIFLQSYKYLGLLNF